MPDLDTTLHLDMLRESPSQASLPSRLVKAVKRELQGPPIYGAEWGEIDQVPPLAFIRNQYVLPYVKSSSVGLEIGPGGGRWTQYLLGFQRLYVVDYHAELLAELRKNFNQPNIVSIENNGSDFPGVPTQSVDYLFSFGVFVHLEQDLIAQYLESMRDVLKPDAIAVIQYSDKDKVMGKNNKAFSENTPERMREMLAYAGYTIQQEDTTSLWHSSVVRFTPAAPA
jgi:SAM-dependent methyltransferase